MDARSGGGKHHGYDRPSPRYWYYFATPLLWWHQYDILKLRNRISFANFVLY